MVGRGGKHYLLAHVDLVGVQAHHGVLGGHHHGGWHRNLGKGLPCCRILGQIHHARLLALSTVSALLLTSSPKVGHSSAAVAFAGDHIHHAFLFAGHAVGCLGSPCMQQTPLLFGPNGGLTCLTKADSRPVIMKAVGRSKYSA